MFEKVKAALVQAFGGFASVAAAKGLGIFGSAVACLQSAYSQVGSAAPDLKHVADSLSSAAATQAPSDPSFFAVAALFAGVSALVGFLGSKLPIWAPKTPAA